MYEYSLREEFLFVFYSVYFDAKNLMGKVREFVWEKV